MGMAWMRRWLGAAALLAALGAEAAPPATLRVDYYHTGGPKGEVFSLDRVVVEPLPWPGNPAKALDPTGFGKYRFTVLDRATLAPLYSRGFCSIYGEWESTGEAAKASRTFSESLRFPRPTVPVRVVLEGRDAGMAFREIWRLDLDPKDMQDDARPPSPGPLLALQTSGDPGAKVDLLILGDGYTAAEQAKFRKDAERLMAQLFAQSPFEEHRASFNVWGLCPPAEVSGISRPSTGIHRRSPVGATYDAFGAERYILTFGNRAFRDIAGFAPYEFVEILCNGRTYGGGGIFGLYGTVASDNAYSGYVFVHEFGHHFAGLADEYYTSEAVLEPSKDRTEPWEFNVTADPAHPKWAALLTPGIPLPTPWAKAAFEAHAVEYLKERKAIRAANRPESEMEALFRKEEAWDTPLLAAGPWGGKVGAFEGASYEARGFYRAQSDCIMFTRDAVPFCAACREAIRRVIALYD